MQLMRGGINIIQQPLRIKRSAGSSDGDEDFQNMIFLRAEYGGIGGSKQVRHIRVGIHRQVDFVESPLDKPEAHLYRPNP